MKNAIVLRIVAMALAFSAAPASAQLVISEFRVRGPNGANDEFIELYNNSGADHTVAGGGTGYAVAASNGVARCVVPNGTVVPNRGHYLCVNSVGYSLASYPAGNGTTATGDATYTTDIPDNAGIAIFNTSVAANFNLANRLDAVGSTSEANSLYKEGTGYPALVPFSIDYSFYRDSCGKGGSITTFGPCPLGGAKDTNNNAADFVFVDTNGTSAGAGQRLGAPGPENLSSPIGGLGTVAVDLLDSCVNADSPPNRVRDFTSDPPNNSTFGTLDIRRTVTNNTGSNMTRLRWRIDDITTFPAPSGIADLRPRTSTAVVVTVDRPMCGSGTSNITVQGTTLEQPPSQPNGGGFNSSVSSGTITLATPLANGATIDVRFLLGIQQAGCFKLGISAETLPGGGFSPPVVIEGHTEVGGIPCGAPVVTSIVRVDPSPTNAASVQYTVTFSEPVTGVDAADFALTTTGVTGASIANVSGSNDIYTVTVNTGSGDGTIRLDVTDDDSIQDMSVPTPIQLGGAGTGNGNFTAGEVYTVDKTSPTVTVNQAIAQADPTNDVAVDFTVVFSEAPTGFTASDVTLGGSAGATTAVISGGPTTFNVAVSGMTTSGTVIASLAAGVVTDAAGNPNAASTSTDNQVTFDNIAPTAAITQDPGQFDPTNTSPIRFTITFSEPVTGFTASDVQLGGTAAPTTAVITGGPTTYTIEVSGMLANGTVTVTVPAGAAQDAAGNGNAAATLTDNSVTFNGLFVPIIVPDVIPTTAPATLLLLGLAVLLIGLGLRRRTG